MSQTSADSHRVAIHGTPSGHGKDGGHKKMYISGILERIERCALKRIYPVFSSATCKLGGEVENILRSHNYIGKHGWKRNPNEIKKTQRHDEAHFWLNGYVNKQNCRIWSEANPQVYVETPLHPETLTVWCALWAGGIIGPYFFKNDEGHNELWFQQDGTTCHTARATIDLLKDTFGDRLILCFGPVNWPPRSCDLTPLDYFLWDYVKSLVYADKPQTRDHLEDNIRRVIADIRPQMLEKVIEKWTSRLDYIRASRGSRMPKIIFKM
ncbi:uncharacterized protein TNCV_4977681 [Trichonephila clavipes]|nr:uncharacterized protein TNCV_4977681 [Trichonephila clavipes]